MGDSTCIIRFKVDKNTTPFYVKIIFSDNHCTMSNYSLRNFQDYCLPKYQVQVYISSLVLTFISKWNSLLLNIRKLISLGHLLMLSSLTIIFVLRDRIQHIIHALTSSQMHKKCDLLKYNIVESPLCTCGKVEDAYHNFFHVLNMLST